MAPVNFACYLPTGHAPRSTLLWAKTHLFLRTGVLIVGMSLFLCLGKKKNYNFTVSQKNRSKLRASRDADV